MHYGQFFVIIATVLPMIMAASLQGRSLPCDSCENPCNLYYKYEDCSADYVKILNQCKATGCIQWFIDPLAHCTCGNPLQACQTYTRYPDCSPEYIADLKKCVASGCIQWIQDPLKHCDSTS